MNGVASRSGSGPSWKMAVLAAIGRGSSLLGICSNLTVEVCGIDGDISRACQQLVGGDGRSDAFQLNFRRKEARADGVNLCVRVHHSDEASGRRSDLGMETNSTPTSCF